jgi:purine-binding chemotaxis protein CheW
MTTLTTPEPETETITSSLGQQLVVFSLHDEQYALPITAVREIIRYRRSRSVGAGGSVLQGVINLRGRLIPICDLSSRLGETLDIHDDSRILIIDTSEGVIGLIVDTVDEVMLVTADQVEDLPVSDNGLGGQVAKVGDRLIILVDAERNLTGLLTAGF